MIKFIREYFGLYYLLYFFSFLSIYFFSPVAPIFSAIILITSYYLIIGKQRFDIIISLILYSRCINGFIILHNENAFFVVNLLTNVIPVILYFSIVLGQDGATIKRKVFYEYKFTFLFFLLLTISFLYNFSTSYDLISVRYLPFVFFVLFLLAFKRLNDFSTDGMLRFFRSIFLSSLIVYFFSDYLSITRDLMESDSIFSVASESNSFSFSYFSFNRNLGPTWDHRILAILSYLFLILTLAKKSKYIKWDIALSLVVVVTSLSRGAMLTYAFILVAYSLQIGKEKLVIAFTSVAIVMGITLIFFQSLMSGSTSEFLKSFNPNSQDNALDQRSVFANYAKGKFIEHPVFGNGVGSLTSRLIDRSIEVDGQIFKKVGDAFWFILAAEMGLIGLVLFSLFLIEVFYSRNLLFVALFAGFAIQLLGTDIPDMRFYYFAILVIAYMAKETAQANLKKPEPS